MRARAGGRPQILLSASRCGPASPFKNRKRNVSVMRIHRQLRSRSQEFEPTSSPVGSHTAPCRSRFERIGLGASSGARVNSKPHSKLCAHKTPFSRAPWPLRITCGCGSLSRFAQRYELMTVLCCQTANGVDSSKTAELNWAAMLNLIKDAGNSAKCVALQELWSLLAERSARRTLLRDARWQRIRVIRNRYPQQCTSRLYGGRPRVCCTLRGVLGPA
jgi:hypothetical protein